MRRKVRSTLIAKKISFVQIAVQGLMYWKWHDAALKSCDIVRIKKAFAAIPLNHTSDSQILSHLIHYMTKPTK